MKMSFFLFPVQLNSPHVKNFSLCNPLELPSPSRSSIAILTQSSLLPPPTFKCIEHASEFLFLKIHLRRQVCVIILQVVSPFFSLCPNASLKCHNLFDSQVQVSYTFYSINPCQICHFCPLENYA